MLKTKKQIAETVIRDYESFINQHRKSSCERFKAFLEKKCADSGICLYLMYNYRINITGNDYIKEHYKYTSDGLSAGYLMLYWYKTPYNAKTKKEVVECLQKRIDILKTWL